jgi:hypothetical protein
VVVVVVVVVVEVEDVEVVTVEVESVTDEVMGSVKSVVTGVEFCVLKVKFPSVFEEK